MKKAFAAVAVLAVSVALTSSLLSQPTPDDAAAQPAEFTGPLIEEAPATANKWFEDYAEVSTLAEALAIFRERLVRDGKEEFFPLLTERRVRAAITTAIESYDSVGGGRLSPELRETYERIAEGGVWPENASFSGFYSVGDRRGTRYIRYEGLGVRLHLRKPEQESRGFALPILDVYYGRFAR